MNRREDEESSSDTSEEDEPDQASSNRVKRGIDWCGVEDEPSNSTHGSLKKVHYYGNPNFSNKMQLYSGTKHFLAVYPDGSVRGTQDGSDLHTYLEVKNSGSIGHVRIYGLLTRLYVSMDKKGKLYAENNMWIEGTVFVESLNWKGYKTYESSAFPNWYLGIKRSGKFKKGAKTRPNQKACGFLSVRDKFQ